MRPYYIIVLVLLFSFTSAAQQWKNFSDTAIHFTAKYPPSWTNKIKEGNRVFFTSPSDGVTDKFLENVNVGVTENPAFGVSIQVRDAVPSILENVGAAFSDFKLETERYFNWNGSNACEIIYSGYLKSDTSIKLRLTQWFCFYKTRLYTVTFTSTAINNTHDTEARKIMSSILFR